MSRRCRAECLSGERHREEIREESGEGKRGDKVTAECRRRLAAKEAAEARRQRRVEGSRQVAAKEGGGERASGGEGGGEH